MHHAVQGLEMAILGNYRFERLRGDGGYGFGIPGAAAGELDRLLSNTMLAWLLDSLSMQVLVTWHTATGEASSNLAD